MNNLKIERDWLKRMDGHGYDFSDSYFKNPYLSMKLYDEEREPEPDYSEFEEALEMAAARLDGREPDLKSFRHRTSWSPNTAIHVPTEQELRWRGLPDVLRFEEASKALFKYNPLDFFQKNGKEMVNLYQLFKGF